MNNHGPIHPTYDTSVCPRLLRKGSSPTITTIGATIFPITHSSVSIHPRKRSTTRCQQCHALLCSYVVVCRVDAHECLGPRDVHPNRPTADAVSNAEPSAVLYASRAAPPRTHPRATSASTSIARPPFVMTPSTFRCTSSEFESSFMHALDYRVPSGTRLLRAWRARRAASCTTSGRLEGPSRPGPNTSPADQTTRSRSRLLKWRAPSAQTR